MWCCGRAKISWTERVKNEKVLHTDAEERNVLHKIKRRKANWIGHILRMICLIKAFLKERYNARKGEVEDISSYSMTVRKQQDAGI
jgi:hypothetical protein